MTRTNPMIRLGLLLGLLAGCDATQNLGANVDAGTSDEEVRLTLVRSRVDRGGSGGERCVGARRSGAPGMLVGHVRA